jgi:hypothetical protein
MTTGILTGTATADTFDDRAEFLLNWALERQGQNPKQGFWLAQARFQKGMDKEAREMIGMLLDRLHPSDPPFQLWACMDTYLRWQEKYTEELREKTKRTMLALEFFDRRKVSMTENKEMMLAAACYLSHVAWPDATFASRFTPTDPHGRAKLLEKAEEYVHHGEREHNSPTYYVHHFGPFLSVADLGNDPELKKKAALAAEWMLVAAAPQWLAGHWAAPTRRIYRPFRAQSAYRASTILLWLYFGGEKPLPPPSEYSFAILAVVSPYRPPAILEQIANARTKPYVHRETHHSPRPPMTYYSTTYMDRDYALFSMVEDVPQWPRWNNQVLRWGVCWRHPRNKSMLFLLHPTNTKVKNLGASRYEQVLQDRGTLLSVFNVPEDDPNPVLRGYVPTGAEDAIDESAKGRLYLDYGVVYIALRLTEGFPWQADRDQFVVPTRQAGLVVETAPADAYPSLAEFRTAIAPRFDATKWKPGAIPSLSHGTLSITYDGPRTIDGKEQVYSLKTWPLLDNPWMRQAYNSDHLEIQLGNRKRTYDFATWTVR